MVVLVAAMGANGLRVGNDKSIETDGETRSRTPVRT